MPPWYQGPDPLNLGGNGGDNSGGSNDNRDGGGNPIEDTWNWATPDVGSGGLSGIENGWNYATPDIGNIGGGIEDTWNDVTPDMNMPQMPDVNPADGLGWFPTTGPVLPTGPILPTDGPWMPGLDSAVGGAADWFEGTADWSLGGTADTIGSIGNDLGEGATGLIGGIGNALGQFFQGTGVPNFANDSMNKMLMFGVAGLGALALILWAVM